MKSALLKRSRLRLTLVLPGLILLQSCETTRQTSTEISSNWCDIMDALGGKLSLSRKDDLTDETRRHILYINQYGMKSCGWK